MHLQFEEESFFLPIHPEPAGLGMKSPSHSQRYVPISFTQRPLMHIPVTEHSSISEKRKRRRIYHIFYDEVISQCSASRF